jgi:hypothetical protein
MIQRFRQHVCKAKPRIDPGFFPAAICSVFQFLTYAGFNRSFP